MSDNTIRCGLDGCTSQQCGTFGVHTWRTQTTVSGCLPTAIPQRTVYLSLYVDIDDRAREPDEIMLGLFSDPNSEDGVEAWMTVAEAERVRNLLDSAIRRHTAYRQIGG